MEFKPDFYFFLSILKTFIVIYVYYIKKKPLNTVNCRARTNFSVHIYQKLASFIIIGLWSVGRFSFSLSQTKSTMELINLVHHWKQTSLNSFNSACVHKSCKKGVFLYLYFYKIPITFIKC